MLPAFINGDRRAALPFLTNWFRLCLWARAGTRTYKLFCEFCGALLRQSSRAIPMWAWNVSLLPSIAPFELIENYGIRWIIYEIRRRDNMVGGKPAITQMHFDDWIERLAVKSARRRCHECFMNRRRLRQIFATKLLTFFCRGSYNRRQRVTSARTAGGVRHEMFVQLNDRV